MWRVVLALVTISLLGAGNVQGAASRTMVPDQGRQAPERSSSPTPAPASGPTPLPSPAQRDFSGLSTFIQGESDASGAQVAVTLVELAGPDAAGWSYNGDSQFVAASTYKLALLMAEAEGIANGTWSGSDQLCFQDADYQDGYYQDYVTDACYSRDELALRAGQQSDNTAAWILVRYLGGADALNAYARAHGATQSVLFDPNVTTPDDLASLWVSEATGRAGGAAAQAWLYPLLQNTAHESGIPAGLVGGVVAHKVGMIDDTVNDAALVLNGPRGPYVLIVCTSGLGGDAAWAVIAQISSQVSQLEGARSP